MSDNTEIIKLGNWDFNLKFGSEIADFDVEAFKTKPGVKQTLNYISESQERLLPLITHAIREEYEAAWSDRGAFDKDIVDDILPRVDNDEHLLKLVTPLNLNVFEADKDGYSYVGLEFDCTWDDEHGIGILTYKDKIVRHGGAEVSFTEWMAKDPENES